MSWKETTWENVVVIKNGKNQKNVFNPEGKYPIYGSGGIIGRADDFLCEAGSTIIGRKGSINNPIYVNEKYWNVDTAFGLHPKKELNNRFFYYFCTTYDFLRHNKTVTIPSLTKTDLLKIKIPLPPLPQQQKIANILDAADSLRQNDKALIAKYDELTQALFLDMFGDPVSNPKGWECFTGQNIFKFSSGKFNPTKNLNDSFDYPTYGGNGITGYSCEFLVDFDTIVIGRVGAYCGSVHKTKGKIWVTDNAIYIKDFKKEINLVYCYHALEKYRLNRFADFSGQPKITQKPLENLQVMFPPLELQNQFAERVAVIEEQKAIAQKSLEQSESLFNSLLQKAFKGELV